MIIHSFAGWGKKVFKKYFRKYFVTVQQRKRPVLDQRTYRNITTNSFRDNDRLRRHTHNVETRRKFHQPQQSRRHFD